MNKILKKLDEAEERFAYIRPDAVPYLVALRIALQGLDYFRVYPSTVESLKERIAEALGVKPEKRIPEQSSDNMSPEAHPSAPRHAWD